MDLVWPNAYGCNSMWYSIVRRIPLDSIDPSLALGFYCRNRGMHALIVFCISFIIWCGLTSCALGFNALFSWYSCPDAVLCITEEFDDLCARSSELAEQSNGAPMFTVAQNSAPIKPADTSDRALVLQESHPKEPSSEDDWQILWKT